MKLNIKKVLSIFKFPRAELESKWWHRLFKVAIIAGTIIIFIFSFELSREMFYPYYIYSFNADFNKYSGMVKNYDDMKLSYSDVGMMVFQYKYSKNKGFYEYVDALQTTGKGDYEIEKIMRADGLLKNVMVKDLQSNFKYNYYRVAFIILWPILCYLVFVHIVYRTLIYILVGKKKA